MVIMITYDLNRFKDYPRLYKAIGQLGETKRDSGLDSVWFVSTSYTIERCIDHVAAAVDADDKIFLCKLFDGYYNGRLNTEVWSWIRARL